MNPHEKNTKLLSLVVCGKNDSYQGNFLYRLTTCINFAAQQLAKIGRLDDVEILVGDWSSEEPLSAAIPLTPEARKICRFVYIPQKVAQTLRPDGGFFPAAALNAGLRRATGTYQALYDADSLFPAYSFRAIFDLLDGNNRFDPSNSFLFLNRHHIPWEIVQSQPTTDEWENYLLLHGGDLPEDTHNYGSGGWGAGHMAHRNVWRELQGYNENLKGSGWSDIELTLRATQKYRLVHLSGFGVHLFHMEHWPRNRRGNYSNTLFNKSLVNPSVTANDKDWGFGQYDLEIQTPDENPTLPPYSRVIKPLPEINDIPKSIKNSENREFIKKFLNDLDYIRKTNPSAEIHEKHDMELLFFLGWYTREYMPRTFYYYGSTLSLPTAIVAKACWSATIYTVNQGNRSMGEITSTLAPLSILLARTSYRGYARHITGDPSTALQRLKNSNPIPLSINLALINDHLSQEDTIREISEITPLLEPRSMLALISDSPEHLATILEKSPLGQLLKIPYPSQTKAYFLKD